MGREPGTYFSVDPGQLHAAATKATEVAENILDAVRKQVMQLADAGPHTNWAVSQALGRCADAWERELSNAARAASAAGTGLAQSASAYVGHDSTAANRFQALLSGRDGGASGG
jgi:hypothetical protein